MANEKEKRYFWIKLRQDFFNDPYIKLLRRMAGGDTYTIIYLKMLIKSADTNGTIYFEGAGADIAEELSLILDEGVEDVRALLAYLEAKNLLIHPELNNDIYLVKTADLTGSETGSAQRVRKFRERQNEQIALQSNGGVTISNDSKSKSKSKNIEIDTEIKNNLVVPQSENNETASKKSLEAETKKQLENQFEELWKKYPKKAGKPMALKAFLKAVKSGVEIDLISKKIDEYNQQINFRKTEKQFIRNGSTWFNQQGWLDEYEISKRNARDVDTSQMSEQEIYDLWFK